MHLANVQEAESSGGSSARHLNVQQVSINTIGPMRLQILEHAAASRAVSSSRQKPAGKCRNRTVTLNVRNVPPHYRHASAGITQSVVHRAGLQADVLEVQGMFRGVSLLSEKETADAAAFAADDHYGNS